MGAGVGEVEQKQEVAARCRRDAVVGLDHPPVVGNDLVQVDDPEPGDRLRLAFVEDLEVLLGQTPDGLAVARDDVDRHLHLEDELPPLELAQVPRLLGGGGGRRKRNRGQRQRRRSGNLAGE